MSKKPSLASALQTFDRSPQPAAAVAAPAATKTAEAAPAKAPTRVGKKAFTVYFDPEAAKQIKQMALDRDISVQELFREGINDLFGKYHKPSIA